MSALYNEIDPFAAQWLDNLLTAQFLPPGQVDRRSIAELTEAPAVFHTFAGIGGWPLALLLAGWPIDRPVWTGSCPCQPFSSAGKKKGISDERHLWPEWFRLVRKFRPPTIFGEQVANSGGLAWFDVVSTDLESEGYAVAAVDLAAGSVAPHKRQRLFFVAHSHESRISVHEGFWKSGSPKDGASNSRTSVGDTDEDTSGWHAGGIPDSQGEDPSMRGYFDGSWDASWRCADGKHRPVKSGIRPLAHGLPGRVGQLRAYGNAIVPQVAARFIRACM